VSGAGSLQKHCAARAKQQLSKSTRVVIQPTMIVRAIFGEGPLLAQSGHWRNYRRQLSVDSVEKVFFG
jgi:hypothetical protein